MSFLFKDRRSGRVLSSETLDLKRVNQELDKIDDEKQQRKQKILEEWAQQKAKELE